MHNFESPSNWKSPNKIVDFPSSSFSSVCDVDTFSEQDEEEPGKRDSRCDFDLFPDTHDNLPAEEDVLDDDQEKKPIKKTIQNSNLRAKFRKRTKKTNPWFKQIARKIDNNLKNMDIHFRIDIADLRFAFYQQEKTQERIVLKNRPAFKISFPPSSLFFKKNDEECVLNAYGFEVSSTCSFKVLVMFFLVSCY